jgi:gliding motility-associated-like protein
MDSVIKVIHVEPGFNVFVPNAFTPNQDPLNNEFKPVLRGVVSYKMQIFDRWGELIFQTTDQNAGWDGTYKGKPAKQDSYVYLIDAGDGKNTQVTKKGHFSLIR